MKNLYIKGMLLIFAFVLSMNANAVEKKISLSPAELSQLKVGNILKGKYEVLGIYPSNAKKGVKKGYNDWIPKEGWESYGTGAGTYIRTDEDNGLVDPGEIHCKIYSQPMASSPDTLFFKIENFFGLIHTNPKTGGTDTTLVSLYFKCNQKTGKCVIPVQDMNLFISVINRTTGDQYDLECFLGDIVEYQGLSQKYYDYYPCEADLSYGLFTLNIAYFCEMGGFGLSEEKFLMDGSKPEWTEWEEIGTTTYTHGLMVNEEEGENGIQEDIVTYKRIYNPNPKIFELKFEEWGAGFWTRSGVDLIMHVNDDATITIDRQETGETVEDDETGEEKPLYVSDLVTFNSDTFTAPECSSTYDTATKSAIILPTYFYFKDEETGSCSGYFARFPNDEGGFDEKFQDSFVLHEVAGPYVVEGDKYVAILEDKTMQEPFASNVDPETSEATNVNKNMSTLKVKTDNILMTAVSGTTPKNDPDGGQMIDEDGEVLEWNPVKWEAKNQGDIAFSYINGSGNPFIDIYAEPYQHDGEVVPGKYNAVYTYYKSDGSEGLPVMGLYYKFTASQDGVLKVNIWANKGNRRTFVVDEDTEMAIPYIVEGYINGQNEKVWDPEKGDSVSVKKWLSNAEIQALHDAAGKTDPEDAYIIGAGNQPFWGTIAFPVEEGKTYWLFQHSSQVGFQGFEFSTGGEVLKGDANGDNIVNVNDISTVATYILNGTADPFVFDNADANSDGIINVNDISTTASIILGN